LFDFFLQVPLAGSYPFRNRCSSGKAGQIKSNNNNNQTRKVAIMKKEKIIRAWKDEAYRMSLSEAERALLPASPVGAIELSDAQLRAVTGGMPKLSMGCNTADTLKCVSTFFCLHDQQ
jgi:mersacidin/lichenicidin family type 2 lantibiotic